MSQFAQEGRISANPWGLTNREAQVMDGILQHGCHKLVARELGIGVATVQTYAERIKQKMGVGGHRLRHILQWHDYRNSRAPAHLPEAA